MTQYEASLAAGFSTQNWQMYEAGRRAFSQAQIETLTRAISASPEELMVQRARLLGIEQAAPPRQPDTGDRSFEIPVFGRAGLDQDGAHFAEDGAAPLGAIDLKDLRSRSVGATRVAGDSMIPWAGPGELVIYDRDRWPKQGEGCVIETEDGRLWVKVYNHTADGHVFAKQFNPDQLVPFKLPVRGVYAIRLRGD